MPEGVANARGWFAADTMLPDDATLAAVLVRKGPLPSTCISSLEPWREQIANWHAAGNSAASDQCDHSLALDDASLQRPLVDTA